MKLLILGGPRFLGRHLIDAALARGHEVTLFNRGKSNPDLYPEVEKLQGDREGDLKALQGRRFDAVIDTCGYYPSIVGASAELLADAVDHYTFISSVSAYDPHVTDPVVDENSVLDTIPPDKWEEATVVGSLNGAGGVYYGALKALCEQTLEEIMPGRVLNIRPGLIVGPHDSSDRFTYWPHRVAQGGEVLAPNMKQPEVMVIDARDLAEWIIRMSEAKKTGVYNATGARFTIQQLLEECKRVIGSDVSFTWVSDEFLVEQEVGQWMEFPLWIPQPEEPFRFWRTTNDKAIAAGLTYCPLAETIRDTWVWDAERPVDEERHAGLKPQRETELLQAWHGKENA